MNFDMTYCSENSQSLCPVSMLCKRAKPLSYLRTFQEKGKPLSISNFEPDKGKDCEGYMPKKENK